MTPLDRAASLLLFLIVQLDVSVPSDRAWPVRGRELTAAAATGSDAAQQTPTEVSLDVGPQPILFRQGPLTANRRIMTADARFRRTERVHLELPVRAGLKADSGRLLDHSGVSVDVPVEVSERTDPLTRRRWITADVTLASLAPADYVIEVRIAEKPDTWLTVATGFRVVK